MRINKSIQLIVLFSIGILSIVVTYLSLYDFNTKNTIIPNSNPAPMPDKLNYIVYYGALDSRVKAILKQSDLVILSPQNANLKRRDVLEIQLGVDPKDPSDDVKVIAYISIGEDLRTAGISDETLATDPRFYGDKTGPRVDPRGIYPDGNPNFEGIDPIGSPSNTTGGYASYYLDDNDHDGLPDRNKNFDGCFVNAGDPKWFETLDNMRMDSEDKLAGLKEILTLDYGRGLGCDGVFLDTVDTCAPNSFTSPSDDNPSEFEWTAPGFNHFIKNLKQKYSNALIVQNRGLFFINNDLPHYQYRTTTDIDYLMFESYRLNSNDFEEYSDQYFYDNKYNYMPKIMAEANRPNGFKVISLGYAEGPPSNLSKETLNGTSELGLETLLEDINETVYHAGFNHYITDASVTLANTFVLTHLKPEDNDPPVWVSTFNDHQSEQTPPTPRVGIQDAFFENGALVVRWDVAVDRYPIQYTLYVQEKPYDFKNGPELTDATAYPLKNLPSRNYEEGSGPGVYAHEDVISGLDDSKTYYLVIRAKDKSTGQHEEKNTVVIKTKPLNR